MTDDGYVIEYHWCGRDMEVRGDTARCRHIRLDGSRCGKILSTRMPCPRPQLEPWHMSRAAVEKARRPAHAA